MGIVTISKIFVVTFIPLFMSQLSIKHFTTLVRWNTVYHSIQSSLNTIWWDHKLFYFLQVYGNFPGGSFYHLPSTLWKSRNIPTKYRLYVLCICIVDMELFLNSSDNSGACNGISQKNLSNVSSGSQYLFIYSKVPL